MPKVLCAVGAVLMDKTMSSDSANFAEPSFSTKVLLKVWRLDGTNLSKDENLYTMKVWSREW